jgi:hypothetical protein
MTWNRVPLVLLLMFHSLESWRKIVWKLLHGRTKNQREIPMISKYSVFVIGSRLINSIFMSKKFSVPLTSESVTSDQAGGVFRQLFLQCIIPPKACSTVCTFNTISLQTEVTKPLEETNCWNTNINCFLHAHYINI